MSLPISKLPARFISVIGADAERFLQGQSSCDLSELDRQHFTYGTLNSPKGRMYAFFKAVRIEDGFLLSLHSTTLDSSLEKLKKYIVFFKCALLEAQYIAYGGYLNTIEELRELAPGSDKLKLDLEPSAKTGNDKLLVIRHPGKHQLVELWCTENLNEERIDEVVTAQWCSHAAHDGIPELYAETQDTFILQELNLQDLG